MLKNKKLIAGAPIVLAAVVVLAYMGFKSSATYYYLVDEVIVRGTSAYGKNLRVEGKMVQDSVVQDGAGGRLRFTLSGDAKTLPVVYQGVVPDTFYQPDAQAVVEGRLGADGVFQASGLAARCPSKYVPEEKQAQ